MRHRQRHSVFAHCLGRLAGTLPVQEIRFGHRASIDAVRRVRVVHADDAINVLEGQRFEQYGSDDAENGGVGTDPEGEREKRRRSEARGAQ
jgi:hypothetical protein